MRKLWIVTGSAATLVVGVGVGLWAGAAYHERLATVFRSSGPQERLVNVAAGGIPSSQMKSSTATPPTGGKTLFHCGMHPWIIQDHPGNCPICHMELTPVLAAATQVAVAEKKILYYWDPMLGASSISPTPGMSAMGMELVPVYADEFSGGPAITIDPTVVQNMGVQIAAVRRGSLTKSLRTVGYLEVPETGLCDITVKVNGYIDKLYANQTGMHIHKGQPLFDLYSSDLVVAEEELIAARKSVEAMGAAEEDVRKQAQTMMDGARLKLRLLDVPDDQIDTTAKQDHASKDITVRSPAEGHLEDKMIVQGSSVQAGMKLMRIEDHETLWLEAQVYEGQLPLVKLGAAADATLDAFPGKTFTGPIIFISPHLDHMNRTTSVRVLLDNPELDLKPGMYATVQIHAEPIEEAIIVPREAVIDTGIRMIAFVQEAAGHFSPRLVTTGVSGDNDQLQILTGLAPGETVVTSGQFLMDVESRTQEAIEKLETPQLPTTAPSPETAEPRTEAPAPATTMANGTTDEMMKAYLAVAATLQKEAGSKAADVAELLSATTKFSETCPHEEQPLVKGLSDAVTSMKDQPLARQRKLFENVGAAIVPLVEKDPPSSAVAPKLYVANCPMEKAEWLQTQDGISNPFLPSMRTCGSITKTLTLAPAK
jgi:RND family efflux transporter MFP subunit